jgi:hypothetical protein
MIKVAILQTEWSNDKVLRHYRKMTPNNSGQWKDMIAVTSIDEADYVAIIDYTNQDIKDKPAIYLGAHPPPMSGYRCFDNAKNAIAKFDLRDTFGFGEWWSEFDYDTFTKLEPPVKTKKLSTILSEKSVNLGHQQRLTFVNNFCAKYSNKIDIYGRVRPQQIPNVRNSYKGVLGFQRGDKDYVELFNTGKTPALLPYKYTLEFDDDWGCPNYFSERFFDDMLFWCMPIYSGGSGIHKFIPENSFRYFDRVNSKPEEIIEIINSDFREKHIEDMREARNLLLNKYQLWARVYNAIKDIK